jgi:hypothetical protein
LGRRSRKRIASASPSERDDLTAPPPRPSAPAPAPRRRGRPRLDEAPPAPWGSFPLVELCVLIALVLGILGLIIWGHRGQVMLACAAALGSLAGLEISIREHFAGYRSHTSVLAGAVCVAVLAILFFARAPQYLMLVLGAVAFGATFWVMRGIFRRRSGGLSFR